MGRSSSTSWRILASARERRPLRLCICKTLEKTRFAMDCARVSLNVDVGEDGQVRVDLSPAPATPPTEPVEIEEPMAFKVGVVAGADGNLRLSLELDGSVVATFPQTEEGREEFWRHMDTIRVAQATGEGLGETLQAMRIGE